MLACTDIFSLVCVAGSLLPRKAEQLLQSGSHPVHTKQLLVVDFCRRSAAVFDLPGWGGRQCFMSKPFCDANSESHTCSAAE